MPVGRRSWIGEEIAGRSTLRERHEEAARSPTATACVRPTALGSKDTRANRLGQHTLEGSAESR